MAFDFYTYYLDCPCSDNPTATFTENKKQIKSKLDQYQKELKVYDKEMFSPIYKHDQSKKDRDAEIKYLHNKIEKSLFEDDLIFSGNLTSLRTL